MCHLKDVLLGEKDPGTPDEVIDLASAKGRGIQDNLLDKYSGIANQNADQLAEQQVTAQENQILRNSQDNQMRAQQMAAQRGIGGSTMGMQSLLNNQADT